MANTTIKSKRIAVGMSQAELAARSGIKPAILSRYENGHSLPSYKSLQKLADVFSCSYLDLGPFDGDLRGQRFGSLTVKTFTGELTYDHNTLWECECSCGNFVIRSSESLRKGRSGVCEECYRRLYRVEMLGRTFGQLTVLEKTDRKAYGQLAVWKCQCSCGEFTEADTAYLRYRNDPCCCKCQAVRKIANININRHDANIDGTNLGYIRPDRRLSSSNTSGVNGVNHRKKSKSSKCWSAEIGFKSGRYYLGIYADKNEAIAIRKKAEKLLYEPYREWRERHKGDVMDGTAGDFLETEQFHKFTEWHKRLRS